MHLHLLSVLAWLGMLLGQGWLAATGRFESHRALGRLSLVLVPLVFVGFALVTSYGQQRNKEPALLGATFLDGSLFLILYALAMLNRGRPALHSRSMMLTPLCFLNPTLGRAVSPALSAPLELIIFVGLWVAARQSTVEALIGQQDAFWQRPRNKRLRVWADSEAGFRGAASQSRRSTS